MPWTKQNRLDKLANKPLVDFLGFYSENTRWTVTMNTSGKFDYQIRCQEDLRRDEGFHIKWIIDVWKRIPPSWPHRTSNLLIKQTLKRCHASTLSSIKQKRVQLLCQRLNLEFNPAKYIFLFFINLSADRWLCCCVQTFSSSEIRSIFLLGGYTSDIQELTIETRSIIKLCETK